MHFAIFGERLCDVVKKRKHPCPTSSLVDVFKPYRLYLCGSLCFDRDAFYSSVITSSFTPRNDSFGRRNYMYKRCRLKVFSLESLIPYLGKIIFRASDWTAAPAKKPELGS